MKQYPPNFNPNTLPKENETVGFNPYENNGNHETEENKLLNQQNPNQNFNTPQYYSQSQPIFSNFHNQQNLNLDKNYQNQVFEGQNINADYSSSGIQGQSNNPYYQNQVFQGQGNNNLHYANQANQNQATNPYYNSMGNTSYVPPNQNINLNVNDNTNCNQPFIYPTTGLNTNNLDQPPSRVEITLPENLKFCMILTAICCFLVFLVLLIIK